MDISFLPLLLTEILLPMTKARASISISVGEGIRDVRDDDIPEIDGNDRSAGLDV